MRIVGAVSSGLGRAHVFMSQPHYQSQFKRILGMTAWPGTLNLAVKGQSLLNQLALRKLAGLSTDEDTSTVNIEGIEAKKVEGACHWTTESILSGYANILWEKLIIYSYQFQEN